MPNQPAGEPLPDFALSVEPVISHLRVALGEIIAGIPGFTYSRPNDLATALRLDAKLAWNIGRCLGETDTFASARFIPGPSGMRAFLGAAQKSGATKAVLENTREAFKAFREMVRKHAGSRKHFNMLAAGFSVTDRVRSDIEHRRMLFDGNTYLWGVQARTVFRTCLVFPSQDADTWDVATIRGFIGFSPMRPNVAWRIPQPSSVDSQHNIHADVGARPLDPRANGPLPLLTEFCSQPAPRFRRTLGAVGLPEFEFIENSVGNTARINFIIAELLQRIEPRQRSDLYPDFCVSFSVRTPARALVFDLLLHRAAFVGSGPLSAELYGDLFGGGPALRYGVGDRLPLHESLVQLGAGTGAAFTPDIPHYPKILNYALRQIGRTGDEFDLYRLRMQYPPLPTTLMLRKPLRESA